MNISIILPSWRQTAEPMPTPSIDGEAPHFFKKFFKKPIDKPTCLRYNIIAPRGRDRGECGQKYIDIIDISNREKK